MLLTLDHVCTNQKSLENVFQTLGKISFPESIGKSWEILGNPGKFRNLGKLCYEKSEIFLTVPAISSLVVGRLIDWAFQTDNLVDWIPIKNTIKLNANKKHDLSIQVLRCHLNLNPATGVKICGFCTSFDSHNSYLK